MKNTMCKLTRIGIQYINAMRFVTFWGLVVEELGSCDLFELRVDWLSSRGSKALVQNLSRLRSGDRKMFWALHWAMGHLGE